MLLGGEVNGGVRVRGGILGVGRKKPGDEGSQAGGEQAYGAQTHQILSFMSDYAA